MASFAGARASSPALRSAEPRQPEPRQRAGSTRARLIGAAVLLGASLAACYEPKLIIFTSESGLTDAGGEGGAPPASQSQAASVDRAVPGSERAAPAGSLEEAAVNAGVPLDAGGSTGARDAAADAAP